MKALTLYQPWAWAVAWAGKPVENRQHAFPTFVMGRDVAIHGGLTMEVEALEEIAGTFGARPANYRLPGHTYTALAVGILSVGAVAAVVRMAGWVRVRRLETSLSHDSFRSHLEVVNYAGITSAEAEDAAKSGWAGGPYLWVMKEVRALEVPVLCSGERGLWDLPRNVEDLVLEQLQEGH